MAPVPSSRSATLTLPTDEEILITREFDAPRHLVYKAWTTPELVRQWWHAGRGEMTDCTIDLRVGGTYRFAMIAQPGFEVAFHGEFREIVPDERLVHTEVYEGDPSSTEENAPLNIITFEEHDGRTTVTMLIRAGSKEIRDAIVESGMEDGLQDALDLLEQAAKSLR